MAIRKSEGLTPTERTLASLCEHTFLKLWSYPNPYREDGKELCDLLVVFENEILIFFDRESRRLESHSGDFGLAWQRWHKEVIDKQIATAEGAARYIRKGRPIYLDSRRETAFPIPIHAPSARIHKIVVAHGAREACRAFSADNVSGSLAIAYGDGDVRGTSQPFFVELDREDVVHVFDTENLGTVLSELDTIFDFTAYLDAKVEAAKRHKLLTYCGEEDLVAHYLMNFDEAGKRHLIGSLENFDFVHIGEGEWEDFKRSEPYKRRRKANRSSYEWDRLIQITSDNALNDRLIGNGDPFSGRSAIHFMAKEPRFARRALSDHVRKAIVHFPETSAPIVRNVSLMPSFWDGTAYVFLQLKVLEKGDYATEYRPRRTALLEIACAAARLRWPKLRRVVGIAIDAPKYAPDINSEDLALLEFDDWDEKKERYYRKLNEEIRFFSTGSMTETKLSITEFPAPPVESAAASIHSVNGRLKIGRNEPCPCGSGKKYKKCCLRKVT
jgi:hypothetical protein